MIRTWKYTAEQKCCIWSPSASAVALTHVFSSALQVRCICMGFVAVLTFKKLSSTFVELAGLSALSIELWRKPVFLNYRGQHFILLLITEKWPLCLCFPLWLQLKHGHLLSRLSVWQTGQVTLIVNNLWGAGMWVKGLLCVSGFVDLSGYAMVDKTIVIKSHNTE